MSLIKVTTKKQFGRETEFTKYLSNSKKDLQDLFETCGILSNFSLDESNVEVNTKDGKRIDITVTTENNEVITIECQDTNGLLDANHAAKSQYYAFDQNASVNIIICEDSPETLREYIRYENLHPNKNNFLVEYSIISDTKSLFINWTSVVKAPSYSERMKRSCNSPKTTSLIPSDNINDPIFTISRLTSSNGNIKIQMSCKNKTRIRNRRLNDSPEGISTIKYDCWSNRHSDSWASTNLNSIDDITKVEILWQGNDENEYKVKQKELKK
jgi:hypothetical protein